MIKIFTGSNVSDVENLANNFKTKSKPVTAHLTYIHNHYVLTVVYGEK